MSVVTAQSIANQVYTDLGIDITLYHTGELEKLKDQLERFLDTEIETDELSPPSDLEDDEDLLEGTEEDEENEQ